jgi:hypothetical protein
MKPEQTSATAQDRLSTWEEIRRATSETPDQILEQCYTKGTYCEIESDLGGKIQYPAEEFEFYAYLSELGTWHLN